LEVNLKLVYFSARASVFFAQLPRNNSTKLSQRARAHDLQHTDLQSKSLSKPPPQFNRRKRIKANLGQCKLNVNFSIWLEQKVMDFLARLNGKEIDACFFRQDAPGFIVR
jgi:hypothetical protein